MTFGMLVNGIYCVDGALLQCSKGAEIAYLNTSRRQTSIGDHMVGLETDSNANNVTGNFGICTATNLPEICIKAFAERWENVSTSAFFAEYTPFYNQAACDVWRARSYYEKYLEQVLAAVYEVNNYFTASFTVNFWGIAKLYQLMPLVEVNNTNATVVDSVDLQSKSQFLKSLMPVPKGEWSQDILAESNSNRGQYYNGPLSDSLRIGNMESFVNSIDYNMTKLKTLYDERPNKRLKIKNPEYYTRAMENLEKARNSIAGCSGATTEHAALLLTTSQLHCPARGGVVTFVKDGQNIAHSDQAAKTLGNLRERVRRTIRLHYAADSNADENAEQLSPDEMFYQQLANLGVGENIIEAIQNKDKSEESETEITRLNGEITAAETALEALEQNPVGKHFEIAQAQSRLAKARVERSAVVPKRAAGTDSAQQIVNKFLEAMASGNEMAIAPYGITIDNLPYVNRRDTDPYGYHILTNVEVAHHIKRKYDRKKYAEEVIKKFNVNETNNSGNREEDSYTLLAWLILLKENDVTTLESVLEEVSLGLYQDVSIYTWDEARYDNAVDKIKNMADALEPVLPIPKDLNGGRYILGGYLSKKYKIVNGVQHNGVDMMCGNKALVDVYAVRSGIINQVSSSRTAGYGYGVYINPYKTKYTYIYGHHAILYDGIEVERYVLAGKPLGECGNTGMSNGLHVHFEVREDNVHTDPIPFLPDNSVSSSDIKWYTSEATNPKRQGDHSEDATL